MGWGDSVSPCEDKGDASKGHSTKCISDVQRHSEQVEENVKDECCASKGFPNPKKRRRNEKYQKFSDIIGHHHVKLRLKEALLPIALPSHIADSVLKGIRANPTSIFMYGPPGCGKTELAKALAGEAEAAFLPVGPSDVLSKFVGESEASIRSIFKKAIQEAHHMNSKCAILFFDEIDALGQARGGTPNMSQGGGDGCSRRVLAELLIQLNQISCDYGSMDQRNDSVGKSCEKSFSTIDETSRTLQKRVRIIVVAATNRPEDCDAALVRRFSIRVVVGLPSQHDRRRIIKRFLKGIESNISKGQFEDIASATNGWSGADLEHLTREAVMAPVRECIRSAASWTQQEKLLHHFRKLREVTCQDFLDAIQFWMDNQNPNSPPPGFGRRSPTSVVLTDYGSDEDD